MMPPKESARLECQGHCRWVSKTLRCCIEGKVCKATGLRHDCDGRIDPHHEPPVSQGGGDHQTSPLCRRAHNLRHDKGRKWFEENFGISLDKIGAECWQADAYHRMKYENERSQEVSP